MFSSSGRRALAAGSAALLVAAVAVTVALAGALEGDAERHVFASVVYDPPEAVPGFTLTSHTGAPFSLSDVDGKVVVVYFGYTHCPDICPLTLSNLAEARSALPAELRDDLRVVMLTVDPARDTPNLLASYIPFFDETFVGLSGAPEDVERVLANWRIRTELGESDASGNYAVGHPAFTVVLDRDGRRRLKMNYLMTVEQVTADLLAVLEGR